MPNRLPSGPRSFSQNAKNCAIFAVRLAQGLLKPQKTLGKFFWYRYGTLCHPFGAKTGACRSPLVCEFTALFRSIIAFTIWV